MGNTRIRRKRAFWLVGAVFLSLDCVTAIRRNAFQRFLSNRFRKRPRLPPGTHAPFSTIIDTNPAIRNSPIISKDYLEDQDVDSPVGFFQRIFGNPQRLGRFLANTCQVGLIAFLVYKILDTVSELAQEFDQERRPAFRDPSDVLRALEDQEDSESSPIASVGRSLLESGLPLHNHDVDSDSPSVASVLKSLTPAELSLLDQCLYVPNQQNVAWNTISGLEFHKSQLQTMLSFLKQSGPSSRFASLFEHATSIMGVLLYGPPGCGKTFLAKTLVSNARVPCLIVSPSVLLSKYVGESNQNVRNLFRIAKKLAPCVVCIDEVDGLFRERNDNEHEVSRELKTEFLQFWDGMVQSKSPILVLGATSRPFDVDSAVARRFSQSLFVGLPDLATRHELLKKMLEGVPQNKNDLDLYEIATRTEGYSPSDLRKVLQTAAMAGPMRRGDGLATPDVHRALTLTPPTPLPDLYRSQLAQFMQRAGLLSAAPEASGGYWTTDQGNFYDIGTLEIDNETFEQILQVIQDLKWDEGGGESDDDGL